MRATDLLSIENIVPQVGDHFDFELGSMVVESVIVGETEDGYIVEADEKTIALLGLGGALFETYTGFKQYDSEDDDPVMVAKQELVKKIKFNPQRFSDPQKQQAYQNARMTPSNHPGFLGRMTEDSEFDIVITIDNPDVEKDEITGREEPDQIRVGVDWRSYQDEFEVERVVDIDRNEDITKKVSGNPKLYHSILTDVINQLEQQRSRGDNLEEAEYQGRKVALGKPMQGDVKKFKVYVKNPKGNVVKVNFGDKKMKIKKSNPKRRKSFRARHNCANPGPRHKARFWSCRKW